MNPWIPAGLQAAGTIFGGLTAANEMRKLRKDIKAESLRNDDTYRRRYYENPTARADARRLLEITGKRFRDTAREAAGRRAVSGGTEAAEVVARQQAADTLADVAGRIDANARSDRDNAEREWQNRRSRLQDYLNRLRLSKASSIAEAVKSLSDIQ